MIKKSKLENSGISDSQYGKAIFVSTTARLAFRQVNTSYAKVKNDQLNHVIGTFFSQASPTAYFRPKQDDGEAVGEVREGGGAKFISIVYSSHISVLAVKKVPQIPAPVENIPLSSQSSRKVKILKRAKANQFFLEHLYEQVGNLYGLEREEIYNLLKFVEPFHDGDSRKALRSLINNKDKSKVEKLISTIHQKELSTEMRQDSLHPYSLFSVPEGAPLRQTIPISERQ